MYEIAGGPRMATQERPNVHGRKSQRATTPSAAKGLARRNGKAVGRARRDGRWSGAEGPARRAAVQVLRGQPALAAGTTAESDEAAGSGDAAESFSGESSSSMVDSSNGSPPPSTVEA